MRKTVRLTLLSLMLLFVMQPVWAQMDAIRQDFKRYGFAQYHGCDMHLLPSGREKMEDMLQSIENARFYVHVEYYKLWNDSTGRIFLDALARSVKRGVKVRVIYDAFGNSGKAPDVTREFVEEYRQRGVMMYAFDPMRFPYINHALHRLHRKIVIVDGVMVYTGGMNIADYYIKGRPEIGAWRDMHARLTGPIVDGYEKLFAGMWYRITRERLDSVAYSMQGCKTYIDERIADEIRSRGSEAFIVDRKPGRESKAIRQSYISCLDHARKRVRILNPYIILTSSVRKALRRTIERGVELEILLSHKGDHAISETSTAREVYNLARRGAKVWLYDGGFHHDKIMIVDDTLCTVGTANLDARSLAFDYEVNAYYFSPLMCRELNAYYEKEIQGSTLLTRDNWKTMYTRKQRRMGWWLKGLRGIL